MKRFLAVLQARNLEFVRDRSALAWTVFMPFFLLIGFAVIFSGDEKTLYKVGYVGTVEQLQQADLAFVETSMIQFIPFSNLSVAVSKLGHHQIDMLLEFEPKLAYRINSSSPNGYILEKVLWGTGGKKLEKRTIDTKEIRYIDWVLPGILSFNIMFGCLFGVGYVIVRYRKSGFLKRLKATPLKAFEFLLAQMLSRLMLMMAITIFVYVGSSLFIDFQMLGSHLLLFAVFMLGAICMISLGLVVAARIASEELAGGLLNLLTWPMMIMSGVWFSLEGANPVIQQAALILPLTHIVDAARAVMTEGAGFVDIWGHLLVLAIMSVVFIAVGARVFRWD